MFKFLPAREDVETFADQLSTEEGSQGEKAKNMDCYTPREIVKILSADRAWVHG